MSFEPCDEEDEENDDGMVHQEGDIVVGDVKCELGKNDVQTGL